ncbi:hypothetical protein [Flexivirga alba]|uniref:Uncharacterized protein n=1 Tax=Flexivirga alba TaxID=702742 RepID=A0ABW2AJP0_9MICO
MTGEGIYYAALTRAAVDGGRGDVAARYRGAVRAQLNTHLHHTWLAARLTTRPAIVEAGITSAAHDQRTFDDLVELGLGGGRLTARLAASLACGLVRNQLIRLKGH